MRRLNKTERSGNTLSERYVNKLQQDKEMHLLRKIDSDMLYMEINNVRRSGLSNRDGTSTSLYNSQ